MLERVYTSFALVFSLPATYQPATSLLLIAISIALAVFLAWTHRPSIMPDKTKHASSAEDPASGSKNYTPTQRTHNTAIHEDHSMGSTHGTVNSKDYLSLNHKTVIQSNTLLPLDAIPLSPSETLHIDKTVEPVGEGLREVYKVKKTVDDTENEHHRSSQAQKSSMI